jgi:branched-chain amino acid transport system permease protein
MPRWLIASVDRSVIDPPRQSILEIVIVVLLAMSLVPPPFRISLLAETLAFTVFAAAFDLLYGYTGLVSFGHAMFVAATGNTVATVFSELGPILQGTFGGATPPVLMLIALVLGVAIAGIFAVDIGYLAVQLEEVRFALSTLSFSMAPYAAANQDIPGQLLAAVGIGDGTFTSQSDGLTFLPGDVSPFGFEFTLVDPGNPVTIHIISVFVFIVAPFFENGVAGVLMRTRADPR